MSFSEHYYLVLSLRNSIFLFLQLTNEPHFSVGMFNFDYRVCSSYLCFFKLLLCKGKMQFCDMSWVRNVVGNRRYQSAYLHDWLYENFH